MRARNPIAEELRGLRLRYGGTGCFILATRQNGEHERWVTRGAFEALDRAATSLGYDDLVDAVWNGALPDTVSEAIEAAEAKLAS